MKHTTDRSHFEKFMREALVFHNVPQHLNLAQVSAAGNFLYIKNFFRFVLQLLTVISILLNLSKTFHSLRIVTPALAFSKSSCTLVVVSLGTHQVKLAPRKVEAVPAMAQPIR
jgi:hypothetical protein